MFVLNCIDIFDARAVVFKSVLCTCYFSLLALYATVTNFLLFFLHIPYLYKLGQCRREVLVNLLFLILSYLLYYFFLCCLSCCAITLWFIIRSKPMCICYYFFMIITCCNCPMSK